MRSPFFRKFGPLLILLVLVLVSSILLYFGGDTFFSIDRIEIIGDPIEVVVNEEKLPKNLLFFPAQKLEEELLADNPLLASLEFKKKLPHTLVIVAHGRKPIAKLHMETLVGLVDKEGYIVGLDDGRLNLPNVDIDSLNLTVGQKPSDPAISAALALIDSIPEGFTIENITRYDRLSLVASLKGTDIIITQDSDHAFLSSTLQTILSGFRIKGIMPTRIDLRFDKPVVEM